MASTRTKLAKLGWRVDTSARFEQAVRDFQGGYALGAALTVDGIVGPKTAAALAASYKQRCAGKASASRYFSFHEFACKCGGRYSTCRRIVLQRKLVVALDAYRVRVGGPVRITSGYRCPSHNARVGGASRSQHLYGSAVDVPPVLPATAVRALGSAVRGLGLKGGRVLHMDTRSALTTWNY